MTQKSFSYIYLIDDMILLKLNKNNEYEVFGGRMPSWEPDHISDVILGWY